MQHQYTRQRQGRDFSLQKYLMNTVAANRSDTENIKACDETKQTLARRLEHYKDEAERNTAPIDGHEPIEIRRV
jgi:hypothetical protein